MLVMSVVQPARPLGLPSVNGRAVDGLTAVNRELDLIRKAVTDCGYTADALGTHMGGKSRQYVNAVLNGEKTMSLGFFVLFPDDVKARLVELRGPQYGLVVVRPVMGQEAIRQFVGGLVGLLTGRQAAL